LQQVVAELLVRRIGRDQRREDRHGEEQQEYHQPENGAAVLAEGRPELAEPAGRRGGDQGGFGHLVRHRLSLSGSGD